MTILSKCRLRRDEVLAAYPPDGSFVDFEGRTIHRVCNRGEGPAIVLEAAGGSNSIQWRWVIDELGANRTVCAYDRAGLGYSLGARASTLVGVAKDLRSIVSDLAPPYVLVGHSLGAAYVQAFAFLYPELVDGLVLVDPSPADPSALQKLGVSPLRAWLMSNVLRLAPWLARIGIHSFARMSREASRGLPDAELDRAEALWRLPEQLEEVAKELLSMTKMLPALDVMRLPVRRTIVLSSDTPPKGQHFDPEAWFALHREVTVRTTAAEFRRVPGANHYSVAADRRFAAHIAQAVRDVADSSMNPTLG